MNLDYKAPTPIGPPLMAKAWIENVKRNILRCQAEVWDENKLLAKAQLTYYMKKM